MFVPPRPFPKVSEALAAQAGLKGGRGYRSITPSGAEALQADQREVYRKVQVPGSIAYLESPAPGEAGIVAVLIVTGGDRMLRVALGRNRTANLVQELVKVLV